MNAEINFIHTAGLLLLQHVRLMLIVQEFDNWHPRIAVVDIISEARCVNDSEADCKSCQWQLNRGKNLQNCTFKELFLQFSFCDLDFDGLVHLFCVSALVIGIVFDCGGE